MLDIQYILPLWTNINFKYGTDKIGHNARVYSKGLYKCSIGYGDISIGISEAYIRVYIECDPNGNWHKYSYA